MMGAEGLKSAGEALAELREDPWFPYPEAVSLLMAFGEDGVPDLVAALDDPQPRIRAAAARALGASASEAAAEALARALRDPEAEVRRAAAAAMADHPGAQWVEALGEMLSSSEDRTEQLTAAHVLGELGAPAVPVLARELKQYGGGDPWVPGEIAAALGRTGAPEAGRPLVEALRHPLAHVRQSAIEALTALGGPAQPAAEALLAFAGDESEDPYLRQLAAEAAREVARGGTKLRE